jgi:hypothetical protein
MSNLKPGDELLCINLEGLTKFQLGLVKNKKLTVYAIHSFVIGGISFNNIRSVFFKSIRFTFYNSYKFNKLKDLL